MKASLDTHGDIAPRYDGGNSAGNQANSINQQSPTTNNGGDEPTKGGTS
ncbi:hypothetical protein Tam10B_0635 [Bifidobacterium vansinderenii]|uniref:Uncharacterized protein n=1 Tax=Bifidobacterium vansinderenii TaxID=1984871 RepID=A0A229VZL1_9BIFI|nr:hypothetical protein Tam10B_0635 [Bifidobacterium vansinderenii]